MELAKRPSTAAAVALAATSIIAVGPVTAPPPDLPEIQSNAVQLTAFDPNDLTEVLQLALANATDIGNHFFPAPYPDVQQFIANLPAYLAGTRSIGGDLTSAYNSTITPFEPVNPEPYIYSSLDRTPSDISISALGTHLFDIPLPGKADLLDIFIHGLNFNILGVPVHIDVLSLLLGNTLASQVEPYLNFSGSPLSGILWGDIGTTLGPIVQLHDDITGIVDALSGSNPDYLTALQDLLNAPVNVLNAFLNGYGDVRFDTLLTDLGVTAPASGFNPEVELGGLLSTAGSLINAVGFTNTLGDCSIGCAAFEVPTAAVGPIASMVELEQAIAEAIGWDGVGNPLAGLLTMF